MAKLQKHWRSLKTLSTTLETIRQAEAENIPVVVMDVETNGLSTIDNRIIQFSAIVCHVENMKLIIDRNFNKYIRHIFLRLLQT